MIKIAIIGAGGQLGQALLRRCEQRSLQVLPISHANGAIDLGVCPPALPMLSIDVTHAILCASRTNMDDCFRNPIESSRFNVDNTLLLIQSLKARDIGVIFCSSDVVFRGDRGAYIEEDTRDPILEYGRQKCRVEDWLFQNIPAALILRMCKLYSFDAQDPSPVGSTRRALAQGQTVRAALDQVLCPTHVEDAAEAILDLIELNASGPIHLAPPPDGWYSRYALAMILATRLNAERAVEACRLTDLSMAQARPANCSLLSHKSETLLGRRLPTLLERLQRMDIGR